MSEFRTIRDALWESPIPTTAKMVALRLVEHLPCVRPSIAGLAERTGLSERAVQYALRELERNGVIVAEPRVGQPSIYRFRGMGPIELFNWGDAPAAPLHIMHHGGEPTAPPGDAPAAPEADNTQADNISGVRSRAAKTLKRLRDPAWRPSRSEAILSLELGVNSVPYEWERFCDHHDKHASRFANWDAAWRTWLREAPKFAAKWAHQQPEKSEWQRKQDEGEWA